jgi:hypothetical protein
MHLQPPSRRLTSVPSMLIVRWAIVLVLLSLLAVPAASVSAQDAVDVGFSPVSGHARVIAQGVVPLPQGNTVWRTVRTRAALPNDAQFEERPLGFILATAGPLLLVDRDSGEQIQLGTGEAALTRAGSNVKISSLGAQPVSYLSIELVAANAPPPPASATVLQPGQPFTPPAGLHDVDLLSDTLTADETLTIPDSGAKNVILITDGTANVGRPGGEPVELLAGEAASFSGELEVSAAPDSGYAGGPAFAVAMIGPEIPPVQGGAAPEATVGVEATAVPQASPAASAGSITIQVFTCPAGMDAESLNAAACAPATIDFDVTLSGANLAAPLTLGDATASGDASIWNDLPLGDYVIAEAVLPSGFTSYVLAAKATSGNPETGYRVSLGAAEPDLTVRIYNFASS